MQCLGSTSEAVTSVKLEPGWSPSANAPCVYASAWNVKNGVFSVTVSRGYPEDCGPLPEPSAAVGLAAGLVLLAALARARR